MPADFASPHTKFVVGPGALDVLNGKNESVKVGPHSHFEADLLPPSRTIELVDPDTTAAQRTNLGDDKLSTRHWLPLGTTLPHTIDIFSDGSLYLVNAPGHLPGHINLLVRTHPSQSSVYLAGDACHDMRLFHGTHSIATWQDDAGKTCCIHVDKPRTEETIKRIRALADGELDGEGFGKVEIVFAHNPDWEAEAKEKGRFWPGSL